MYVLNIYIYIHIHAPNWILGICIFHTIPRRLYYLITERMGDCQWHWKRAHDLNLTMSCQTKHEGWPGGWGLWVIIHYFILKNIQTLQKHYSGVLCFCTEGRLAVVIYRHLFKIQVRFKKKLLSSVSVCSIDKYFTEKHFYLIFVITRGVVEYPKHFSNS